MRLHIVSGDPSLLKMAILIEFPIMRLHIVSGDFAFNSPNRLLTNISYLVFPIMRLHIVSGDRGSDRELGKS